MYLYAKNPERGAPRLPNLAEREDSSLRQSDPDGHLESAIRKAYNYPNGFEDLTHGQARFLSIPSNAAEVLNHLTTPTYSFSRR